MCEDCVKEVYSNHHSLDGGYSANISQFNRKVFCQPYDITGRNSYGYNWGSQRGDRCVQNTFGKKRIEERKRQDHYNLLRVRIFIPLRDINLAVQDVNDPQDRLKLSYGISHLESLPDYDFARQHMHEDLPNELVKPENLQNEVGQFNSDVDDFFNNKTPKIIIETLRSKLSDINIINSDDSLPENTMSYYYLTQKLNRYWVEKLDFDVRCDNGFCKLNGGIDFANIPAPLVANLKTAVRELKTNYLIKTYINLIHMRHIGIIEQSTMLSESINTKIISKIEHQQYKTKCNECSKY